MAKNKIVLSGAPSGRFLEGIVSGTPKPGTVMQIKPNVEPIAGKFTWLVYDRAADSDRPASPLAVLLENWKLGKLTTDAYVDGEYCQMYCPLPGDELLMLVANIAGTGDTFKIGDIMIVDDGTGKLVATTGSPEIEPFIIIETKATALTADTLVECMYTGY